MCVIIIAILAFISIIIISTAITIPPIHGEGWSLGSIAENPRCRRSS